MKLDIRNKTAIFAEISLVTILLWYMFLYAPKKNELKRIKEEQRLIQMQYDQLLDNSSHAMFESAKKLEISKRCIAILDGLPYRKDIASALSKVIEAGEGKDIRIISISPQFSFSDIEGAEQDSELNKMAFDMVVEGKYLDIGHFLFDLLDLPFLVGYSTIDIKSSPETYPETRAQLSCILLFLDDIEKEPATL
ncbi:MAG: type 4a pilus biogenesis protein PilO [bacterium]